MLDTHELSLLFTDDGSETLFSKRFQSTYHSKFGALTESTHVFLDKGLFALYPAKKQINVLEYGIGLGLNAWLFMQACELYNDLTINYIGLELYPVPEEIYSKSAVYLQSPDAFQLIHSKEEFTTAEGFNFKRLNIDMLAFEGENLADLIVYDAFSPDIQPEMWTHDQMKRCAKALKKGGYWVSYCSKGEVRRGLVAAGLIAERLPGPPGKREMLRVQKPLDIPLI